jgi:hypothetical protein
MSCSPPEPTPQPVQDALESSELPPLLSRKPPINPFYYSDTAVGNLYTENRPYAAPQQQQYYQSVTEKFVGKHKEELSVNAKDLVIVLLKNLPCFWFVEHSKTKERGLIPAKYFVAREDRFQIIEAANM